MIFSNHALYQVSAEEVNLGEESAIDEVGVTSGNCGKNLTWILEGDTLTISETGKMKDYSIFTNPSQWYRSSLTTIKIQKGVTSIGNAAFAECTNLTDITIPKSVTSVTIGANVISIGKEAFKNWKKLDTITINSTKLKTVGKNTFKGIKSNAKIKVPNKKIDILQEAVKG